MASLEYEPYETIDPYPFGRDFFCFRCEVGGRNPKEGPHVCWYCGKGDAFDKATWLEIVERKAEEDKRKTLVAAGPR